MLPYVGLAADCVCTISVVKINVAMLNNLRLGVLLMDDIFGSEVLHNVGKVSIWYV